MGGAGNTSSTSGTGYGSGHGSAGTSTTGPHSSNLANKADPRVDSDLALGLLIDLRPSPT